MKTTIKLFSLGLVSALAFSSCSDSFLEDKKNYDNVNKDIYNYYDGCNGRVYDIYSWCLPTTNDLTWKFLLWVMRMRLVSRLKNIVGSALL